MILVTLIFPQASFSNRIVTLESVRFLLTLVALSLVSFLVLRTLGAHESRGIISLKNKVQGFTCITF